MMKAIERKCHEFANQVKKEANIKWWSRQTRVRGRDRSLIKCGVQFTLPSGILCSALITPAILWDLMNLWCWTALRGRKHHQLAENARKDKCKHFTIRLINNTKPKLHCAQIMRKKILYSKIYFDPILMKSKTKSYTQNLAWMFRKLQRKLWIAPFTYIQIKTHALSPYRVKDSVHNFFIISLLFSLAGQLD